MYTDGDMMLGKAVKWISKPTSIELIAVVDYHQSSNNNNNNKSKSTKEEGEEVLLLNIQTSDKEEETHFHSGCISCMSESMVQQTSSSSSTSSGGGDEMTVVVEEGIFQPKCVRFSDPLVTKSLVVPRKDRDLFYNGGDFANFRKQHSAKYGADNKYNRVYCEQLVEQLDEMGVIYFRTNNLERALGAFYHSLRIRTKTQIDLSTQSTATTIHRIGDVYCKMKNWNKALHAYKAAQYAFEKYGSPDDQDVMRSIKTLQRKQTFIKAHSIKQAEIRKKVMAMRK